jgi:glycosyltransferase involved in cell wall biosynthesis
MDAGETERPALILVAPNVSAQKGGEAMKAKQIFEELHKLWPETLQITHARNRAELATHPLRDSIRYVEEEPVAGMLWRLKPLRGLLGPWFSWRAVRLAERLARERFPGARAVIHQTEPNSPVVPRALSRRHANVFGPINGNIYYPPLFREHESVSARLRRILHLPLQRVLRLLPRGLKRADLILAAGGDRTEVSLEAAGVPPGIVVRTLDCGVPDELLARPRIRQTGRNLRFIHFGRLVFHKLPSLIIESLARSQAGVELDVVGDGPELERCKALTARLGLEDRVRFLGWQGNHPALMDSLSAYRGFVLPSIEDANGIVVQEAMALGLVPICLDWGGPQLLVEHGRSGFLVSPSSVDHIITAMAAHMDTLAEDGELAEAMSVQARAQAEQWRWSRLAASWAGLYARLGR